MTKEKTVIVEGSGLQTELLLELNEVDDSLTTAISVSINEPGIEEGTEICTIRSEPDWGDHGEWAVGWNVEVPDYSIMFPVYGGPQPHGFPPKTSPSDTLEEVVESVKFQVRRALKIRSDRDIEACRKERELRELRNKRGAMRCTALAWFEQEDTEE